ncbi:MAG: isocitrate/isopropylmalate dehydrogenase family protein [Clostridia bacterium]|nr:isocitrate/isopropylmalate dehydrogenase family protein [Clostridia bacterium]
MDRLATEIAVQKAKEKFEILLREQIARCEKISQAQGFIRYDELKTLVIGLLPGDGIGPMITQSAETVLRFLLKEEIDGGRIVLRTIEGLTIENRARLRQAVPDDVMEEIKKCHVLLKGPTTTPRPGDPWPNLESANVAIRKELDLFANVRPVRVPEKGIDWTFFRENTEGGYTLGSQGLSVTPDLGLDFVVATNEGCRRIARLAYEYARANGKKRVSIVTKANIIKTTDGKFLEICKEIGREYPEIETDEWFIDIMTAKLIDEKRRGDFQVMILPNLYGDIITDEAAEFQGGVGTAGSANIGKRYAMFEAIHGSAPRMVVEGREKFADPTSMLRASVMLLSHIGRTGASKRLENALDHLTQDPEWKITGRENGKTCREFTARLISLL